MITVTDFSCFGDSSGSNALTLRPSDLDVRINGWVVTGEVHEDYYEWVNYFEANHPSFGRVWGDFESEVHADSQEAYDDFIKNFQPESWDYHDI
jgi:hypothetical protein